MRRDRPTIFLSGNYLRMVLTAEFLESCLITIQGGLAEADEDDFQYFRMVVQEGKGLSQCNASGLLERKPIGASADPWEGDGFDSMTRGQAQAVHRAYEGWRAGGTAAGRSCKGKQLAACPIAPGLS